MSDAPICSHLDTIEVATGNTTGCEDCMRIGSQWLHLRRCTECGHVGCCDSSPNRHATAHNAATAHPLIQSFEPGEDWIYCYADDAMFEIESMLNSPSTPERPYSPVRMRRGATTHVAAHSLPIPSTGARPGEHDDPVPHLVRAPLAQW